jgi:PAS domain-containing protein
MDLTGRKRASEKNYRALMEQAPDGIFVSDHLGNIDERRP